MALNEEQKQGGKRGGPKEVTATVAGRAPCTQDALLQARKVIEEQLLQVCGCGLFFCMFDFELDWEVDGWGSVLLVMF